MPRMKHLFAYGTLMRADIMRAVSGCLPACVPGVVHGYCRRAVRGEAYPALIAAAACRVEGLLYRQVPDAAWPRLDDYEGDMYLRRTVPVVLADGTVETAETYLIDPARASRLAETDWDVAAFLRESPRRWSRCE